MADKAAQPGADEAPAGSARSGIEKLVYVLVKLDLASEEEAAAKGFDPLDCAARALVELKRSNAAEKAQKTRARNQVNVLLARTEPRRLSKVRDQLKIAELAELIAATETVEIAFSDGKRELAGVPPVEVPGEAFGFRRGRLSLEVPELLVVGPADERGPRVLVGYALLIEGEQVAWIPRLGGQLTLGPGVSHQLKDDVTLV